MKRFAPLALLTVASLGFAYADVQPVNIVLHDGSTSYAIPNGKVLIIEHFFWALESDSTSQTIQVRPAAFPNGVGAFLLKFTDAPDSFTPPRPMRVVGGGGANVSILKGGAADWRDVMIMGLLVDPEDLYAVNLKPEYDNHRIEGGRYVVDAKFNSPRPRVTKVESSSDLQAFTADPSAEVQETTSPATATTSVVANSDRKFQKVVATTRETE